MGRVKALSDLNDLVYKMTPYLVNLWKAQDRLRKTPIFASEGEFVVAYDAVEVAMDNLDKLEEV